MKHLRLLVIYLFVLVITDPYKGINYNEINVYDVNYCSDYCYNQNNDDWDYFEEEEIEEIENNIREEYGNEEDKPAPLSLDFWRPRN